MPTHAEKIRTFRSLHRPGRPLLMPNPWDIGSARILAGLGFDALATTSGGFAASLGRLDGSVSRDEALAHAAAMASSVDVPVSADLENCFSDMPDGVAETVRGAVRAGLAGCSVEDYSAHADPGIYDLALAHDRVEAACAAAHDAAPGFVVTARAENFLRGREDLDDTIRRLQAYQEAGADVLYAPAISTIDDIRAIVSSVDRPVNVLAGPRVPRVEELASARVARISVGSSFANAAWAALGHAAAQLRDSGTYGWTDSAAEGSRLVRSFLSAT